MTIYLVSLQSDIKRREKLEKIFPKYYKQFHIINAVDGRELGVKEYFKKTSHFFKYYNRMMSPSELGCSLSHLNIMEDFLDSDEETALVLEDDVTGSDIDIDRIIKLSKKIPADSLVICGCQDGLGNEDYLYGKETNIKGFWEVSDFSNQYISRTASYIITRSSAKVIVKYQKREIMLADNWDKFFVNTLIKIHFIDIFSHPIDLKNSHIEAERIICRGGSKTFLQKLVSKNIYLYIFGKFKFKFSMLMSVGNKKVTMGKNKFD